VSIAPGPHGSVARRVYATSPLRLLTPANHGGAAWVYTSSFGGGLVDGDRIDLRLDVEAGAQAYVSTQSATKVYRSPNGTYSQTEAAVGSRGLLVVAPDAIVPFAGSAYRQRQRFDIAADSGLVVVETLLSGRAASGERWAFTSYESLIQVYVGGRLRIYDPLALRARDGGLAERFGRFDALAVAIVAGAGLREEIAEVLHIARTHDSDPRARPRRSADLVLAASSLGDDACLVRVAAASAERLARVLRDLLQFVPRHLEDDPWRRKW
jgi:urease accessory protein